MKILVISDDDELRHYLMKGLALQRFQVHGAADGNDLDAALRGSSADVVVIDLDQTYPDGCQVAGRLRQYPNVGIVLLSTRGSAEERVRGLESGADSYFVKPVYLQEVAVTVRNLGRRIARESSSSWRLNASESSLYTPSGTRIYLTGRECVLLHLLFANMGREVSRTRIFDELGQPDDIYSHRRLEVMISRLRSKVRQAESDISLPLRVRHNRGYVFLAGR